MVPKLSFFKDQEIRNLNWVSVSFGDVVSKVSTKHKPSNGVMNCIQLEHISQETGKLLGHTYTDKVQSVSTLFTKNNILYSKLRPYLKKYWYAEFNGACTGEIWVLKAEKINSRFLYFVIQTDQFTETANISSGSKMPRADWNLVSKYRFHAPSFEEQQKIASFLSSVDEKISQLEKKKTLLETYKRGIMQKIFSQELRFKDDNGKEFLEWKEDSLGNIFDHKKGTGLSGKELVKDGEYPCILYGALYTKYDEVIKSVVEFSNIPGKVKSISGDLLVPASTTTSGIDLANFTALNQDGVSLGGDITIMRNKNEGDNSFWAYYLTHFHKKGIAKYAQGTTIVHLYYSHFKHLVVRYPCFKEQQKIASFLLSIDKKIDITSTQLEKTREFKKGLLQQMFV